jgi:photosystem II stability/assembly factor-like uncharacterized protein
LRHIKANLTYLIFSSLIVAAIFIFAGTTPPGQPVSESPHESTSGAGKAMTLWSDARSFPGHTISNASVARGFEQVALKRSYRDGADSLVEPWETMGPLNIGGRTLALAFDPVDPDVMYAGSASGGLWRTSTGGVGVWAWEYVETGFPVLGVGTVAVDPSDRDVIFIGTGEGYRHQVSDGGEVVRTLRGSYGIGILKSTDRGASWEKSLDWAYSDNAGVWAIRFHPTNSNILFAATTEGIYRSVNGGADWQLVLDVVMGTDLEIHPTNPDIIFAGCGNFASSAYGVYRSLDGGTTWDSLYGGLPATWSGKVMLDICESQPNLIYASIGNEDSTRGLYWSQDTGNTWTLLNNQDYAQYQGWFAHWAIVNPEDPSELFAGGIDVWRSTNGGSSLSQRTHWYLWNMDDTSPQGGPEGPDDYVHADQHFAIYHPTNRDIIYFATDGGVFRTTDSGATYEGCNGAYQTTQFYNGFSTSQSTADRAIGGLQDNATVIYSGTTSWRFAIGGDGFWTAIHPTDPEKLFGEYYYLNMLRSSNGGYNWSGITPPEQSGDYSCFSSPFVLSPSDPQVLYAGRSRVYKTTNEGNSWSATNLGGPLDGTNPVFAMAISCISPDTVYAATAPLDNDRDVYRTYNGGTTWTNISGPLPERYPADLAVDPGNAANVYVAFSGFGTSHLFKSTDGGDSWIDIGGDLPDLPTSAVIVDPDYPNVIYAGNDAGVFVSTNGGTSWGSFDSGMPTAMVADLKISQPNRKLRVATHGLGIFERDLVDGSSCDVETERDTDLITDSARELNLQVSPNPLQSHGLVSFRLPEAATVRVEIIDVTGRIATSVAQREFAAGDHQLDLDTSELGGGVYYLRLITGTTEVMRSITLMR